MVNLPSASYVFRDGEGRRCNDSASRFIRKQFQYHQTSIDDFSPTAFVFTMTDPIEPVTLSIMLLSIDYLGRYVSRDMIRDIIAEDE